MPTFGTMLTSEDGVTIRLPTRKPSPAKPSKLSVEIFVGIMMFVIGVQGAYLGYFVGVLTNLERSFGITSEKAGLLISLHDVGHTVAVLLIGFFIRGNHLPRITAAGVGLSSISMFLLALPAVLFGALPADELSLSRHRQEYILENICDSSRIPDMNEFAKSCTHEEEGRHILAFWLITVGQVLAGIATAPFNTVAYVYIDDNLEDKAYTPFYLGLLSSMYAFAPVFGFAMSAGLTSIYTTLVDVPPNLTINSDEWVGAWWLGFIILGVLYLFAIVPILLFPKSFFTHHSEHIEMQHLRHNHTHNDHQVVSTVSDTTVKPSICRTLKQDTIAFGEIAFDLLKNPVYMMIILGWMFSSYLTGGYGTYLPQYIENQYGRSASAADFYAGLISIGSIAVSTALGGYLLKKYNPAPRKALLVLAGCWTVIFITYLIGMTVGCNEPQLTEMIYGNTGAEFKGLSACNSECHCEQVHHFNPVHYQNINYFSPCHAGCREFDPSLEKWNACSCVNDGPVDNGLSLPNCDQVYIYVAIMFVGLFIGNLYFMTTMMIVLRSVYDDEKLLALSIASCFSNLFGFIPAPIILGHIIDGTCILWHNRCPDGYGNCVVYENKTYRRNFHISLAAFQLCAVVCVLICYILCRRFTFPEEEGYEDDEMDRTTDALPRHRYVRRTENRRSNDDQFQTVFSPGSVDLLDTSRDDNHQYYNLIPSRSEDNTDDDLYLKPKKAVSASTSESENLPESSHRSTSHHTQTTI